MKKLLFLSLILGLNPLFAQTDILLNQKGSEIDFTQQIQVQKQLVLNDPFLIQLYTSWKANKSTDAKTDAWFGLIFDHQFGAALKEMPNVQLGSISKVKDGVELYLLYQNGLVQNFVQKWVEVSSSTPFLSSEIGLALDQVVAKGATQLILVNGITLTDELRAGLKKIEPLQSKFNYSIQAYNALRTGENAVQWIGKLETTDPLRMPLAQTAILAYTKDGKLGASGKLIKGVVEPILDTSDNEEEIALYFMTLGRLLYQAGALDEAKKYYELIPESSAYFLKARSEALWVYLREKDYAKTKGELATLELSIFNDKFYPEAYVVSAMANVLLCQFVEARKSINRFVEANKKWAKEIVSQLKNAEPTPVVENQEVVALTRARDSINREIETVSNLGYSALYSDRLKKLSELNKQIYTQVVRNQWVNRQKILETALYKMKFVKIELISRMRQVALNQQVEGRDEVRHFAAATAKNNQMRFPSDGVLWSDDLFQMTADVQNKCIKGDWK